ncbi:MAG: hypothetical protein GF390_00860 [Candidatus Pacebacteria bacterium]|nr:hypothetical protein [Candidatus Paceibacterota bacterium]
MQEDQRHPQPEQKTVVEQVQGEINNIPSLADINKYGEQVIRSAQNHPKLRDQIGNMLQGRRESLMASHRVEIRSKIDKANLATLNTDLSINAIRKSFIDAGMTEEEAENSVNDILQHYNDRLKKLEEEQA